MPKLSINYTNTVIYKIVCNDLNITDLYVGHTTEFIKRKSCHKTTCINPNSKNHNLKVYKMIRENGGWDNWTMVEIEKFECQDRNEAGARERHYYELLNSKLNTSYPNRSDKQYREDNKEKIKQYRVDNKEKIKQYRVDNKEKNSERDIQYREDNKEKIKQYRVDNKEKIKQYRVDNKEKKCEQDKQYYQDNKEKISERNKKYYQANKPVEVL